ncbi:MAG TPA: YhcH/YjgK/YiaL family protein [Ohtaekwangia sp.]|uniref:YhcH/YjgK/YiaL family protein n=1 Tax=Ohtaekwangia sp. TaxID=2066019 RepID=UPI002F948C9F
MITGTVNDLHRYAGVIPSISDIQQFLIKNELPNIGEWHVLSGDLKVIRLNDWNRNSALYETHTKNYDLHFTLRGKDKMKISLDYRNMEVTDPYDPEKDFTLYRGEVDVELLLRQQHWAFILPNEPHRNQFEEEGTEKLVFKIRVREQWER